MSPNMTFIDSTEGVSSLWAGLHHASGGWLTGLFLLSLWTVIIIMFSKNNDFDRVLLSSSFIIAIVAGLFYFMNALQAWILILPVLGVIVGLMLLIFGQK